MRRDEHDRPCPLEVGLEPARVLVGSVRKRVVEREAGLAALAHAEGGAACKEQDTHDQREKGRRTQSVPGDRRVPTSNVCLR